ncbi:MAG: MFS transporter [Betaproteobacteria bacterium]|nr:MFS transporter [Betaproteobacteria bacterium]
MPSPPEHPMRMSRFELRASASLASLFALRMIGLFLILPVFAVHATKLRGGESLTLVGLALGAYGLTQAMLHLPFGMASDRFGRKRVIILGLIIFAAGSFLAASANDIYWTIAGRALQGAGAISAAVVAFVADLTRDEHRTKAMAIIGASIGLAFAISLVAAPGLYRVIGMEGIFTLTGVMAIVGIWVTLQVVPPEPATRRTAAIGTPRKRLREIVLDPQLLRLNLGIFTLHLTQMAMFVVVPHALIQYGGLPVADHWKVYLPVVIGSFILMVPPVLAAERRRKLKSVFLGSIAVLALVEIGFAGFGKSFAVIVGLLLAFFVAFNILEASLPSLVSRVAPVSARGTAIGIYNTTQSLGLFAGGALGGWLAQHFGAGAVFAVSAALVITWGIVASSMTVPPLAASRTIPIGPVDDPERLRAALVSVNGVREAIVIPEHGVAHLKVLPGWDEGSVMKLVGGKA